MDNVGSNGTSASPTRNDPLTIESVASTHHQTAQVYVTIPQNALQGNKGQVHSVIQQPQQSVIQSTSLPTVQLGKSGNLYLLKQPNNSVIQSAGGNSLQAVQVISSESIDEHVEPNRKRQILARRPSYKKILNDISIGGEKEGGSSDSSQDETSVGTITVSGPQYQTAGLLKGAIEIIPASTLQIAGQGGESIQSLAMTNTASAGGTIVHYAPGNSEGQLIVPVATSDMLKIGTSVGSVGQNAVVLTTSSTSHSGDTLVEEANRKREIRLMKNREAARECRAKKKEYIKCLENRVAVLENQNKTLIEELQTLKEMYKLNDIKQPQML